MSKNKISLAVITYNEEKNIARCIESAKNIVDEIIIVDSLSTDNTEAIVNSLGVDQFIKQPFLGHKEQKQFAIDSTSNEYVLLLDADEHLDDELIQVLLNIKSSLFDYDGYALNRLNNYCGQYIWHCWYPEYRIRLFNKKKAEMVGVNPHDTISSKGHLKMSTQKLKGHIIHFSYRSYSDHLNTINNFTTISAKNYNASNTVPSLLKTIISPFFKFLQTYFYKKGFLDGFNGFVISINSAYYKFLKLIKTRELNK